MNLIAFWQQFAEVFWCNKSNISQLSGQSKFGSIVQSYLLIRIAIIISRQGCKITK